MSRKKLNAFGMASDRKHIRLHRWMMDSPAWQSLSLGARCLLLEVWNRHTGENNGAISMSVREASDLLGIGVNAPTRLFGELQDKGFLKVRRKGSFTRKGGKASTWELTMERCDGNPPTKEFMRWRPSKIQNTVTPTVTTGHAERDSLGRKSAHGHADSDRRAEIVPLHGHAERDTYSLPSRGPEE